MANDTKRMEMVAENLIAHFLQRHGILVAKPYFDQEGGDLFAFTSDGGIRCCRVQCKGRTVRPNKRSSVKIPISYVSDSMIVCTFVDDGSFDRLNLFIFFREDIQGWAKTIKTGFYRLPLEHATFQETLKKYRASEAIIERIANQVMKTELPTTAKYKFTGSGGGCLGGEAEEHLSVP